MTEMTDIESVRKAFREARIAGEKMLSQGKLTWEAHSFAMLGFEAQLKTMGERL